MSRIMLWFNLQPQSIMRETERCMREAEIRRYFCRRQVYHTVCRCNQMDIGTRRLWPVEYAIELPSGLHGTDAAPTRLG